MKGLSEHYKNVLRYFIRRIVPRFDAYGYNVSYIKLVFKKEDIEKIKEIILEEESINEGYYVLNKNLEEYTERRDENTNYIVISDYIKFTELIYCMYEFLTDNEKHYQTTIDTYFLTIWLRMGVNDLSNVEAFLKKQYYFLLNDYYMNKGYEFRGKKNGYDLCYETRPNASYFESNKHLTFYLNDEKHNKKYRFPSIHYAIINEDGEMKCYFYGIQNLEDKPSKDLKNMLRDELKDLRNGTITPIFILTLKYFIDLLKDIGITKIEMPLIQVFNYDLHDELDRTCTRSYEDYSEEEKKEYEKLDELNTDKMNFIHTKKMYHKFHGKADEISKNKTERLIDTILLMQEHFNNIEILNEPFLQGDSLIIKILDKKNKVLTK